MLCLALYILRSLVCDVGSEKPLSPTVSKKPRTCTQFREQGMSPQLLAKRQLDVRLFAQRGGEANL